MKYSNKIIPYFAIAIAAIALTIIIYRNPGQSTTLPSTVNDQEVVEIIHPVSLLQEGAEPNELIIKLNESIQFNSKDGQYHNIAFGKGNDYDQDHEHVGIPETGSESGDFGPNEGYLVKFRKAGTYYFHDHNNPNIFVTVLVY